jgi:hypothetical protein
VLLMNDPGFDRFEVISHCKDPDAILTHERPGRVLIAVGVKIELSVQDDGRTLKVFLTDRNKPEEVS